MKGKTDNDGETDVEGNKVGEEEWWCWRSERGQWKERKGNAREKEAEDDNLGIGDNDDDCVDNANK